MLTKMFQSEAAPLTAQGLGAGFSAAASMGMSSNPSMDLGADIGMHAER